MRQFNSRIVANTLTNEERMNYLEQYTSGEANKIVLGYSTLDSDKGYPAVLKEFQDRYGDSDKIAHAYIHKALNWPLIDANNAKAIDDFSIFLMECENAVTSIEAAKVLEYPDNMLQLVKTLPYHLHDKWRNIVYGLKEKNLKIKFSDLTSFVRREAKKSTDPVYGRDALVRKDSTTGKKGGPKFVTQKHPVRAKGTFATVEEKKKRETVGPTTASTDMKQHPQPASVRPCLHCDSLQHTLISCEAFNTLTYDSRLDVLRTKRACFGCMKPGHRSKDCRKRLTCEKCHRRHPTALHMEERPVQTGDEATTKNPSPKASACMTNITNDDDAEVTMAIIPVKVKLKNSNRAIDTYAFLDPGSTVNFCTIDLMRRLGAGGKKARITLETMGSEHTMQTYIIKGLEVCDLNSNNSVDLPRLYTKDRIPVSSRHIPKKEDIMKWPHLSEVDLPEINSEVGLLIGNGVPDAYSPLQSLTGPPGSPHAVRTRLGWITWNVVRGTSNCINIEMRHLVNQAEVTAVGELEDLERLDRLVRSSINLDFPERGIEETEYSQEDKRYMKIMEKSIHVKDGHYEMKLPFRRENIQLPNNHSQALQRLSSLRNKMKKNSKFHQDYKDFMEDILDKEYAEEVPDSEIDRGDGKVWYIPHHGVYHPRKPEKIRVVFDCSAKYAGLSLNDTLLQGPNLTNNLVGVLLRFRRYPVAILADIEKMFYQVWVDGEDMDYLRFLWWPGGDLEAEPRTHRMKVHLFGAVSSPSCANLALRRTAEDQRENYKEETVGGILRSFYVDDCLESVETDVKAISHVKELKSICNEGGFKLTKWLSNSRVVLESIPAEERSKGAKNLNLDKDNLPIERTLGVTWQVFK
jgi:hypothetical protein